MLFKNKIEFTLSIDTLKKMGAIPEYNKTFVKGGIIKAKAEILKVFNDKKDVEADYMQEMTKENKKREDKLQKEMAPAIVKQEAAIAKYIADNQLKPTKTSNGVYVVITNAGEGAKADSGMQASVMYKGYTLDGKVFDANMGEGAKHTEPLSVVLGSHKVIRGWEDGLKLFGKGGKGKIIIPFQMAYGPEGMPPAIPTFSPLVFDVEIKDITTAPKADEAKPMNLPGH